MPEVKHPQGSAEWLAARAGKITASVAAGCLGLNPHMSRQAAWRHIVGSNTEQANGAMAWGTEHEADAVAEYEAVTGLMTHTTGFWIHPRYPWLGASPDRLVGDDGMIETKCPRQHPDKVPVYHRIQMYLGLICTGRLWCDYVTWTPEECRITRLTLPSPKMHGLVVALDKFRLAYVEKMAEPERKKANRRKK